MCSIEEDGESRIERRIESRIERRTKAGGERAGSGSGRFGEPVFETPEFARRMLAELRDVSAVDVRGLDDETALGLFDALEVADRHFHAARLALVAELDARDLTVRRLGHVVPNEAGWRHGADPRRVKSDLSVAKVLRRDLPQVASALAAGDLAVDRAREIARRVNAGNRDVLAGIQAELLAIAAVPGTFRRFVLDIEQICRLADEDGSEPPVPRDHGGVSQSGDQVTATFDLYGTRAVEFAQRLNAEADRLHRSAVSDHERDDALEVPPRSELLAQAVMNLCETGAAHRFAGRQGPAASVAIVIDATAAEAAHLFHNGVLLPGPGVGAPVDWSKRARLIDGSRPRCSTRDWEMLTCDPEISWTITGNGGHPVACRSGERHASREQRRNLEFRDGRCCFPGCDAPASWCDAHHVTHHSNGGPTETSNLALLCRRHHGTVHRNGWTMTANLDPGEGEGFYVITTPSGAVLHTQHERGPGWRDAVPA